MYCYPPPPPPRWGGVFLQSCLVSGCATLLAPFVLIIGLFIFLGILAGSGIQEATSGIATEYAPTAVPNLRQKVIRPGAPGRGTIAVINIIGVIDGSGSEMEGAGKLRQVSEQLDAVEADPSIKAVLFQVDSPGGGLTPSDILHNRVKKLRDQGRHVLFWTGSLMASGGYYVASGGEGIMASPTAIVGSIGVIMHRFQVEGLMDKIGVKSDPIMAGRRKDIGSPFRDMTPEEREIFQRSVDHAHNRFIDIVAEGRKLDRSKVEKLADGSIFTAQDSLDNGLVDRIGYVGDAVAWAEELCEAKNMRIIAYRRQLSLGDIFNAPDEAVANILLRASRDASRPEIMALWTGE